MDLRKLLGIEEYTSPRLNKEFPLKIERKARGSVVEFDANVKGYFVGKGGKPDFVPEMITVKGIPDMNIQKFLPDELKQVKKYALSIELPKLMGQKSQP